MRIQEGMSNQKGISLRGIDVPSQVIYIRHHRLSERQLKTGSIDYQTGSSRQSE